MISDAVGSFVINNPNIDNTVNLSNFLLIRLGNLDSGIGIFDIPFKLLSVINLCISISCEVCFEVRGLIKSNALVPPGNFDIKLKSEPLTSYFDRRNNLEL